MFHGKNGNFEIYNIILIFIVILYSLHLLRNILPFYSYFPPILCSIVFLYCLAFGGYRFNFKRELPLIAFCFSSLYVVGISAASLSNHDFVVGLQRFVYMLPLFGCALVCIDDARKLRAMLLVLSVFVVFAAVSFIYQEFFGAISWFAQPSTRESSIRYASLTGSLTSFGVVVGLALTFLAINVNNNLLRNASVVLLVVGSIYSIQKSAFVNVLLASLFIMYFDKARRISYVFSVGFAISISIVLSNYAGDITANEVFSAHEAAATVSEAPSPNEGAATAAYKNLVSPVEDRALHLSILDRLWSLPFKLFEEYGILGMLMGKGFIGASGSLGFPSMPMAHSMPFELLALGGILYLFSVAYLFTSCFTRYRIFYKSFATRVNSRNAKLLYTILACMIVILINALFTSGIFVQPYFTMYVILVYIPVLRMEYIFSNSNEGCTDGKF